MQVLTAADPERIAALRERGEFFWLDLESPSSADVDALGEVLGLHPLAVADTRNFDQRPKLDDFGDHVLLVFWSVRPARDDPERHWRPLEHHLYVSGDFVMTVRQREFPPLDRLHEPIRECSGDEEAHVVYRILRTLCDAFDGPLADLESRIDELEASVFERVERTDLKVLYHARQELQDLLRRMAAQRDGFPLAAAAIERLPGLAQGRREELSDVRDQLVEIAGELQRHHDDAATLIQLYFSASGDRLNRLAYRLTILATFFVIGTLVTGFFGQNFGWLVDSIDSRRDFLIYGVGGLTVPTVVFAAMVWWRRKDWL